MLWAQLGKAITNLGKMVMNDMFYNVFLCMNLFEYMSFLQYDLRYISPNIPLPCKKCVEAIFNNTTIQNNIKQQVCYLKRWSQSLTKGLTYMLSRSLCTRCRHQNRVGENRNAKFVHKKKRKCLSRNLIKLPCPCCWTDVIHVHASFNSKL